eukprot:762424-Hanusia_phi.AAC.9
MYQRKFLSSSGAVALGCGGRRRKRDQTSGRTSLASSSFIMRMYESISFCSSMACSISSTECPSFIILPDSFSTAAFLNSSIWLELVQDDANQQVGDAIEGHKVEDEEEDQPGPDRVRAPHRILHVAGERAVGGRGEEELSEGECEGVEVLVGRPGAVIPQLAVAEVTFALDLVGAELRAGEGCVDAVARGSVLHWAPEELHGKERHEHVPAEQDEEDIHADLEGSEALAHDVEHNLDLPDGLHGPDQTGEPDQPKEGSVEEASHDELQQEQDVRHKDHEEVDHVRRVLMQQIHAETPPGQDAEPDLHGEEHIEDQFEVEDHVKPD